jgi:hypothetical protein
MTANAAGRLRFGANPHHTAVNPALNHRRRRGDQYGPSSSLAGAHGLNPWDLIGLTGIIVVVGALLVFWRSLMDQPAQQRTAVWDDRWPIGERPAGQLPRIPLTRRDAL